MPTTEAFFRRAGGGYLPNELIRGPWHRDFAHGGPPSALLARAIQRVEPEAEAMFVSRLTIDLQRPVPVHPESPLIVSATVERAGRRVQRIGATLREGSVVLAQASGVRLRMTEHDLPAATSPSLRFPSPDDCPPFEFPFFRETVAYHKAVELRIAEGEFGRGAMAAWIRPRGLLIEDEPTSALERLVVVADAAHGIGVQLDTTKWSFVNPDLSIHLHRLPESTDWMCLNATTYSEPSGIGLCATEVSDQHGSVGRIVQSQVIEGR